jgi:hypothetical protein
MTKQNKYHSRKFLNKKQGMAAIECIGSVSNYSLDLDINITDCNRKISLDFYAFNPKSAKEKLAKIDLLLSEIDAARCYYAEAIPQFEAEYNKQKAESKLRKKDSPSLLPTSLSELLSDD